MLRTTLLIALHVVLLGHCEALRCEVAPRTTEGRLKKFLVCDVKSVDTTSPQNVDVTLHVKEFYTVSGNHHSEQISLAHAHFCSTVSPH